LNKIISSLVYNYVNARDINNTDAIDVKILENDPAFMMEVIEYTNDKRIYNVCSNKVKKDLEFVKFFINRFSCDKKSIMIVADYYLRSIRNRADIGFIEVNILMAKYLPKSNFLYDPNFDKSIKYHVVPDFLYAKEIPEITASIEAELQDKTIEEREKAEFGLGFLFIIAKYWKSLVVLNFFAEKMLTTIFHENYNCSFEHLVHTQFNSIEELEENGIDDFFISYVNKYDERLSWYIIPHIHLLDDLKKDLEVIKSNWKIYDRRLNKKKSKTAHAYVDKHCKGQYQIIEEVAKELGLEEVFKLENDEIIKLEEIDELSYMNYKTQIQKLLRRLTQKPSLIPKDYDKLLYEEDMLNEENLHYEMRSIKKRKHEIVKVDFSNQDNRRSRI